MIGVNSVQPNSRLELIGVVSNAVNCGAKPAGDPEVIFTRFMAVDQWVDRVISDEGIACFDYYDAEYGQARIPASHPLAESLEWNN